jgi:hypothetical protein
MNQFGYKRTISTIQPMFILKETIAKYKAHHTPCYIASLDLEKAFDRLWRDGLFHKLKGKMNDVLWYMLYKYYRK